MSADNVLFDTMAFVDTMRYEGGMPEKEAKALAKAINVVLHQGVATHDDIVTLNSRITNLETKMDARISNLETKVDAGITNLETKMDARFKMNQMVIYTILAITTLTNPVAMHIYHGLGLIK